MHGVDFSEVASQCAAEFDGGRLSEFFEGSVFGRYFAHSLVILFFSESVDLCFQVGNLERKREKQGLIWNDESNGALFLKSNEALEPNRLLSHCTEMSLATPVPLEWVS